MSPRITRLHIVQYRTVGFVGGHTTIVPDKAKGTLGSVSDGLSDSFNEEHARAEILTCYAGACADQKLGFYHESQCETTAQ